MIAALHAVLLIPLGIFAMMVGYLLLLSNSSMHEDEEAARMLEIFSERRFKRIRASQRLRLLAWVIRTKFRSMYVDAEARKPELMEENEADEVVFKIKNDPRVTRAGRLIRKASVDELPQPVLSGKGAY